MKKIILLIEIIFMITRTAFTQTEPDYLCFEVEAGTTITFGAPSKLEYSLDQITWQILTSEGVTASNDCNIYFRGNNPDGLNTSSAYSDYSSFSLTKPAKCSGNIMTLIDQCGLTKKIPCSYCFYKLFYNCKITTAPLLPANQLRPNCYQNMFDGCSYLIEPPDLPANNYVFIAEYCYASMFANCTNLKRIPVLPTERVVSHAYSNMFQNCTSLEKVTLYFTSSAYDNNTYGANVGTTFDGMFSGCSNLKYISVRFKEWYVSRSYYAAGRESRTPVNEAWVKDVCSKGIFVCPSALQKKYGDDYIPTGWTVRTLESLYSISISPSSQPYISISETEELVAGTTISFTIADQPSNCNPAIVTVQGTNTIETTHSGNDYYFTMPRENVTITVTYPPINYTITTDDYSIADKTEASEGETVNVTFKDRAGYTLTSATYNGTELTITNNTSQFTMPAANVTIATTHTPIEYNITAGEFVTVDKTKATINDQVSYTVTDRTDDGYQLDKVLVNNTEFTGTSFKMADYLKDVTITAQYSKIDYTITTDAYSSTNKTAANVGDVINVTFKNRDGYNLKSATYNDNPLTITNNSASFTMPAEAVTIVTTYTPINYTITSDQYATPSKNPANVGDVINVTFSQRDGYNLTSATFNDNPLTITNNAVSFTMPAASVTIATTYTPIYYTITADQYATPSKNPANVGDVITVTFANRDGFNLTSATYNDNPLTITNNTASFTMPAANVTIATTYTPIVYNITTDQYITADKATATINDKVTFTVADRSAEGLLLEKVLINNAVFSGKSFDMKDYLQDVEIKAVYSNNSYTITTDDYSNTDKASANTGDVINVTFAQRDGYNLTSATYNDNPLTITNNTASFTMPAANVTIATTYTPIVYNITTDQYITADKSTATINDKVTFTVADRSAEGLLLEKVLINNAVFSGRSFEMKDYLQDVEIKAVYSNNSYTITTDEYSNTDKASANTGDLISVTFANRDGYTLTSATYNGTELTITNSAAQFTMPAANVTIATTHTLIEYKVTAGEFVTVNKTKATINDQVSFTVADRTDDGYKLDNVLVNNTEFTGRSFNMADYLKDVTITAVYSKNSNPVVEYTITNDEFSTTDKASANEGDVINVTFINRDGYNLTSATYNGTPLNITNNAAQFTMPAANVTIATTYKPIKNDKLLIVDDIIVEADGYCAGDVLRLSFMTTCKKGKYQIMFSERAKTEGFVDLDFADIEDSERQTAKFDIPSSTNYGNYQGFIRVVDADGNEGAAFPFGFNIDYPNDIIETKYADLICVNNFSHNYVAYQWMKNGKEIAGANKQFYIDYPALNGVYNVIVTDQNGNKFKVCDFRAEELKTKSAPKPSVNVYPNPAQSMQPVTIELVGVDNTEKCEIMLYTHSGALVQKIADAKTMNVVYLKSGIYTGVMIINGKKLTFKLIVND